MTTKRKAQSQASRKPAPARMTIAELLKTSGVPLGVWLWLERFAGGDKHALHQFGNDDDPAVVHTARLVYDVLNSKHKETGVGLDERKFPEEATDFVEEWLYKLSNHFRLHVWSDADLAVAALPDLLLSDGIVNLPEGDATFLMLRSAIERLTTRRERRAFLRDEEADALVSEEETDWRASFKLSRLLADPRTPADVRRLIQGLLIELCNSANIIIDHPALARRAYQVAVEQRPKGHVREVKKARANLLRYLESITEEGESSGEQ